MNTYIKTTIAIVLFSLCIPTMAANRFIVKYKLNESQLAFLSSHSGVDAKAAKEKIREELMEKLSKEQLDVLSKAVDKLNTLSTANKIQVTDSHSLGTGAHVIKLSEDLDKTQTEQFIHNVEQDNSIEFIEEDKIVKCKS